MLEPQTCLACKGLGRINAAGEACQRDNAIKTCPQCRGAGKTNFMEGMNYVQNALLDAADQLRGAPEHQTRVAKLDAMIDELSGYMLAPAPAKKVAYAGGDVCGVLVRDAYGQRDGVMAVTDMGRVTRLDNSVIRPDTHAPANPPAKVTHEMKIECIGEFSFPVTMSCSACAFDGPDEDCEVCGGTVEYTQSVDVPWSTCKDIYKGMAAFAPRTARPAPAERPLAPAWMQKITDNLHTQDNRITADPLFVVFQQREIVVDEAYDHDRIAWISEDGETADDDIADRLDELREDPDSDHWTEDEITLSDEDGTMEWRRLALKSVDEFVTACFTEEGAKAYLKRDGHNLRRPHIFVTSLYRNAEMKQLRSWLMEPTQAVTRTTPDDWIAMPPRLTRAMIDAAERVEESGFEDMYQAMVRNRPNHPPQSGA